MSSNVYTGLYSYRRANSPDLNDWEEGEDSVEVALAHDGEGGGGTGSGAASGAAILQRQL